MNRLLSIAPVEEAVYLERTGRFTARLLLRGKPVECHLNDPGRALGLLERHRRVLVRPSWRPGRRTTCSIVAVELSDGTVVLEDLGLANQVFEKTIPLIYGRASYEREVAIAGSRLDYVVVAPGGARVVEVKATNNVVGGAALFPDTPSKRAVKHLDTLALLTAKGHRVELVFVVLRPDAATVKPNHTVDEVFARRMCAYRERITYRAIRVKNSLRGDSLEVYYAGTIPVEPCP